MAEKSTEKKNLDKYKKFLKFFVTPYFIGIVITFGYLRVTFDYFTQKDRPQPPAHVDILKKLHHFSIDLRFRARGPRPVSEDVALITVDEKAVEQEGRWPWPRAKIKKIIENLVNHGTRVIGFDAIFSEEDINATVLALQELKSNPQTPESMHAIIDQSLAKANTDNDLAEGIKAYGDKLVMGVFFPETFHHMASGHLNRYQNMCLNFFYKLSPDSEPWNKTLTPIVFDDTSTIFADEMPEAWAEILTQHSQTLEHKTADEFYKRNNVQPGTPLSKTQKVYLDEHIRDSKKDYCSRWLIDPKDPESKGQGDEIYELFRAAWPKIQPDIEGQPPFEQAVAILKENYKENPVEHARRWEHNYKAISESLKHIGYFNAFQDSDGPIRRTSLLVRSGSTFYPSLALKSFLVAKGKTSDSNFQVKFVADEVDPTASRISDFSILDDEGNNLGSIPVNHRGELLINFAGPQKMFPHVSIADILNDDQNMSYIQRVYDDEAKQWLEKTFKAKKSDFFKNKILLFGATAIGIYDLRVTPFEENFPGLETHANIVDNLIQSNFYVESSKDKEAQMLIFLLVSGIIFTIAVSYFGATTGLLTTVIGVTGIYFYDKVFLFNKGIIVPIIFPLILVSGIFLILTSYKYFTEERNKKMLKSTFEKYVSPAIVHEVLSDPEKIELGGRKERMTVFFSDVRGFTTISEKLDPRALSDLLNSYLTPMTEIVFKNRGTLDKYMGDAIMAFFGAPINYPDHAAWACRCALEQLEKLKVLQDLYRKKGLPEIDIGIGLNTGEMSVGNMGSETVRSYTVMGDSVNLGSRLEGITKQYATKVIISEFTQADIAGKFVTRELDWVKVKGKLKPVKIFELIGENGVPNTMLETVKWFGEGYDHYHKMNWAPAIECFNKALNTMPTDGPSKLYLERCMNYQANPPPSDWDGVFVMKTK